MDISKERISAAQHILASVFASQKALRALAPEYKWAGLGNLLGDFGELVATDHYRQIKAPGGSGNYDATTKEGKSVQIKTNYAASQISFRGEADMILVIGVNDDGSWEEIYYGPFSQVRELASYSKRDNKHVVTISKLKKLTKK